MYFCSGSVDFAGIQGDHFALFGRGRSNSGCLRSDSQVVPCISDPRPQGLSSPDKNIPHSPEKEEPRPNNNSYNTPGRTGDSVSATTAELLVAVAMPR